MIVIVIMCDVFVKIGRRDEQGETQIFGGSETVRFFLSWSCLSRASPNTTPGEPKIQHIATQYPI